MFETVCLWFNPPFGKRLTFVVLKMNSFLALQKSIDLQKSDNNGRERGQDACLLIMILKLLELDNQGKTSTSYVPGKCIQAR